MTITSTRIARNVRAAGIPSSVPSARIWAITLVFPGCHRQGGTAATGPIAAVRDWVADSLIPFVGAIGAEIALEIPTHFGRGSCPGTIGRSYGPVVTIGTLCDCGTCNIPA